MPSTKAIDIQTGVRCVKDRLVGAHMSDDLFKKSKTLSPELNRTAEEVGKT